MNLKDYTAEDLALYQEFRIWVLRPNREINAFWSEWLLMYPEKLPLVNQARLLVENTPFKTDQLSADEVNSIIDNIEAAIHTEDAEPEKETIQLNSYTVTSNIPKNSSKHSRKIWFYSAAATIAILIASTYFLDFNYDTSNREINRYTTKVSPPGQNSLINLTDGSRIWLSAGSSISYLENFTPSSREIKLEGEAYFEVAKDSCRPFTVYSGDISTTALGTSFNINYFQENGFTDVALLTGKAFVEHHIELNTNEKDVILAPGEVVRLENQKLTKTLFEPGSATCWKEGVIKFKDASFQNVKGTLERMYSIEIKTSNSSKHAWSYNGNFDNENLNLVLKKIALTEGFDYSIENNEVDITFNR